MISDGGKATIGRCTDRRYEVSHASGTGPCFGCGNLGIYNNCNENSNSWTGLGQKYDTINGLSNLDQGGKMHFRASEIEVFLVE